MNSIKNKNQLPVSSSWNYTLNDYVWISKLPYVLSKKKKKRHMVLEKITVCGNDITTLSDNLIWRLVVIEEVYVLCK